MKMLLFLALFYFFVCTVSSGHLKIPSHITVLHVEQEVIGDDTLALQSVLECDEKREGLLAEEKEINQKIQSSR